jgi:hypothetical protein
MKVDAARLSTAMNGGVFPSLVAHPLRSVLEFVGWVYDSSELRHSSHQPPSFYL